MVPRSAAPESTPPASPPSDADKDAGAITGTNAMQAISGGPNAGTGAGTNAATDAMQANKDAMLRTPADVPIANHSDDSNDSSDLYVDTQEDTFVDNHGEAVHPQTLTPEVWTWGNGTVVPEGIRQLPPVVHGPPPLLSSPPIPGPATPQSSARRFTINGFVVPLIAAMVNVTSITGPTPAHPRSAPTSGAKMDNPELQQLLDPALDEDVSKDDWPSQQLRLWELRETEDDRNADAFRSREQPR